MTTQVEPGNKTFTSRFERAMAAANAQKQSRIKAAQELVPKLHRAANKSEGRPAIWVEMVAGEMAPGRNDGDFRIVFKGGKKGEHSIWASVSDRERILAHWDGYQEGNGHRPFKVGDTVMYHGSPIDRVGKLINFTGTRGLVQFKYKSGRPGQRWRDLGSLHHFGATGFSSREWGFSGR